MNATTRKAQKQLREIVDQIRVHYHPEQIVLFGSWARGDAAPGDIDLLVVKETQADPWTRLAEVDRFISHKLPVDVLVYTPGELRQRLELNDSFVKEMLEEGVILHDSAT